MKWPPTAWCIAGIIATVLLVFYPTFQTEQWQDDFVLLTHYPERPLTPVAEFLGDSFRIRQPMKIIGLQDYRPLSQEVFYSVCNVAFDRRAGPYKAVLLGLYICISLLVFALVRGLARSNIAGLAAGLFFASRSALALPVFWIAASQELVMLLFVTMGLNCWLRAVDIILRKRVAAGLWGLLAFAAFAGAALSKETAYVLPGFFTSLWLLRFGVRRGDWPRPAMILGGTMILACAVLLVILVGVKMQQASFVERVSLPPATQIQLNMRNLALYIPMALDLNREVFRGLAEGIWPSFSLIWVVYPLALLGFWLALAWLGFAARPWRRDGQVLMAMSWIFLGYLPMISIPTIFYGYYLSVCLVGLAVLFGLLAHRAFEARRRRMLVIPFLGLAVAAGLASIRFEMAAPEGFHRRAESVAGMLDGIETAVEVAGDPRQLVFHDYTYRQWLGLGWGYGVNYRLGIPRCGREEAGGRCLTTYFIPWDEPRQGEPARDGGSLDIHRGDVAGEGATSDP